VKLIEALIIAQQEFGIDGDWRATHDSGCSIGRTPRGVYLAFAPPVISQSDRLETVLSDFAESYPKEVLDDQWKVSRYEQS